MNDETRPNDDEPTGMSRRAMVTGIGAAAAGLGVAGLVAAQGAVAAPTALALGVPRPRVLATPNPALTYLAIDGTAFHGQSGNRYVDDLSGVGHETSGGRLVAPLMLESGSVVQQLNIGYQVSTGDMSLQIMERQLFDGTAVAWQPVAAAVAPNAGGGSRSTTVNLTTPVTIRPGHTYSLRFQTTPGMTIYGVTVGYSPASARFTPFAGAVPRAYDSRETGGRMTSGQERSILLGFPGARAALVNVTITETAGQGFVAAFADGIAYPGNSTINWTSSGTTTANGAVVAMSAAGAIKLRCEVGSTHVIVDRLGWFL